MATDNEQLVLSISADTRQIQRQLKSLVGQTQANTKAIEDAFKGIDGAASGTFDRIAANSNKAFSAGEQGAKRFQAAMKASTVQTGNLAAQLSDIGVQLAGGQSPFLIALQQGTQITQALGSGAGVRGAVSAVAGAFTSLLNPVSLATIGIIAFGGTAIQYLTELVSSGEATEATLEKQAQLIAKLADRWGDVVPALREYADELERAQQSAALDEGLKLVNDKALADTREQIENAKISIADLISQLQAAGAETETVAALQTAFDRFAVAADEGSLKVDEVKSVQDALTSAINSAGIPALADFKVMFDQVSAAALEAAGSIQKTNDAVAQAKSNLNDPTMWRSAGIDYRLRNQNEGTGTEFIATPLDGPTPQSRPLIELGTDDGSSDARKGESARAKAAREAEREREAVANLIEQLEFERSLIGMTAEERAEANALRRAGATATDKQKAKISELVAATYAEREAIEASKEAMQELQDISRDVLEGLVDDLRNGASGADILANALNRVADRLLDSDFDNLFSEKSGATGKGLFGGVIIPGILHDGGVAGSDGYGHGRAFSPSVFRGARRYHTGSSGVGLAADEVPAILQRGEVVLPRGAQIGGSSPSITFAPQIDARGASSEAVARLEAAMDKQQRDFAANVLTTMRKARKTRDWQ